MRDSIQKALGRLEPNDSPRTESIFVTWSSKIYHEVYGGAPVIKINFFV
jgi:hypothetical protein